MGLLDDAIREHLELKRRRGADPSEIERAEREALGPARRRYEEAELGDEPLPDEAVQHAGEEQDWDEDDIDDPHAGAPVHEYDEPDAPDEPEPPGHSEEERPGPAADAPPKPSLHNLDAETSEYDVEAEHNREEDDVLEETPEFLQDTPDHDRLWFEQRPPRDFDFDG
jgi:hypothetical protein